MSDTLPTVWDCSPHTQAKHRILERYLKAWMPILSRSSQQALFVDGFAGPGRYTGGEPGSPVIALRAAIEHCREFSKPIRFLFIEKDPERHAHLLQVLDGMKDNLSSSRNIELLPIISDDCASQLTRLIDEHETRRINFGPALVFLDQFGYSAVPMVLIGRILKHPSCEVLSYLEWNRMHPYLSDPNKTESLNRAFGGDEWRGAIHLKGANREKYLLDAYVNALKSRAGAKFVWQFSMMGEKDTLLYRLFFCTNHPRGLEEMKRAMGSVDESGSFRFSDADDPTQLILLSAATQEWLARYLHKRFNGQSMLVEDLTMHVLTETPLVSFKKALEQLENQEKLSPVDPPGKRRRGHFPNGMKVRFHDATPTKRRPEQGKLF